MGHALYGNDETLAVLELQRDLLFHRISAGHVRSYVSASLLSGREQAEKLRGEGIDSPSIAQLCEKKRIHITLSDSKQGMAGMTFRAKISYARDGGAELTLFRTAIADLVENVNPLLPPESRFTFETARDMLAAHEYYHYLEFSEIGDTADKTEKVEITKLFGKRRFARIMRCSEVAAHAFAKALLNLNFLPNLTDYLYFIATGKWTETDLCARLAQARSLLEPVQEENSGEDMPCL